jgi:hypothetical protein
MTGGAPCLIAEAEAPCRAMAVLKTARLLFVAEVPPLIGGG